MKAVDTNVLLRYLVADDPPQTTIATELLTADVVIPITVMLETGWVLRSRYDRNRGQTCEALRTLLDLPTVHVEDEPAIRWALDRFEAGADFADMLHLVAARGAETFATFDQGLARSAGDGAPIAVESLAGS